MIVGSVDPRRHAIVTLTVRGPEGHEAVIECLLDTGFNGALTLPMSVVQSLGLVILDKAISNLADGSRVEVPVYRVTVVWDGLERTASVIAAGKQPLLGTSLLFGHRLTVDVVDGGEVTIKRL